MRIRRYSLTVATLAFALSASLPFAAGAEKEPSESHKDAAEAVGEGNTARWFDYYRRERGENWKQPVGEEAQKSLPPGERSTEPAKAEH
jgi:hypothetical protein